MEITCQSLRQKLHYRALKEELVTKQLLHAAPQGKALERIMTSSVTV